MSRQERTERKNRDTPKDTGGNINDTNEKFLQTLQNRLLSASDAVSSADSGIEKAISGSMKGINRAQDASTARLESQFTREAGYAFDDGKHVVNQVNEARQGFATSTGILKKIYEDTDKNVKDLQMRKDELVLQGESNAASKIADLQLKALEFKQEATQRTFNNLMSMSSFGLQVTQEKRAQKAQDYNEKAAINNIALQFGLPVSENETLDSITGKAAPFASTRQSLEFAKMRADIAKAQAESRKAVEGKSFKLDKLTASALAQSVYQMTARGETEQANAILANILEKHGADGLALVKNAQYDITNQEFSSENLRSSIAAEYQDGSSYGDIEASITGNPFSTPEQKKNAKKIADELRPKKKPMFQGLLQSFTSGSSSQGNNNNRISQGFNDLSKAKPQDFSSFKDLFK